MVGAGVGGKGCGLNPPRDTPESRNLLIEVFGRLPRLELPEVGVVVAADQFASLALHERAHDLRLLLARRPICCLCCLSLSPARVYKGPSFITKNGCRSNDTPQPN